MYNPWENIFSIGVPDDLREPIPIFGKFIEDVNEKFKGDKICILDIACGSGRHTIELAKHGFNVSAFDLSSSGLKILSNSITEQNITNVDIKVSNMFDTFPYTDESFHAAIAIQAIYHGMPDDMAKSINEAARILRKGGIFFFTVSTEMQRSMLGANRFLYKQVADKVYLPLVGREKGLAHYYPDSEDLKSLLSKNFTNVKIYNDLNTKYFIVSCEKV